MDEKGIYCLIFENDSCTLSVGGLGEIAFCAGWHTYAGSALGPGGLSRVKRHIRLARERDRKPHWHIDRLLLSPHFRLVGVITAETEERLECPLAGAIGGTSVRGFGCSDCRCPSHLFWREEEPFAEIHEAFISLGLSPLRATLK